MIRFQRVGRRRQASFRLVLVEKETGPRGKALEFLGSWNPQTKHLILKKERVDYWLGKGAKPSESAHNLLVRERIISGSKIPVHQVQEKEAPTLAEGEAPTAEQVGGAEPQKEESPAEEEAKVEEEAAPAQQETAE